jgi:anti-sigma B factor antagonist
MPVDHDRPGTPLSAICSLDAERNLGTLILRLYGEFDLSCEERFGEDLAKLLGGNPATLIVDLRGLTFMDSTGLRALVALHQRATVTNLDFAVLYDGGPVSRVLHETRLDQVLPVVHTENAISPSAMTP